MKKILCISLTVFLIIALSACVKSQDPAPSRAAEPDTTVSADVPTAPSDSQVSSDDADSQASSGSIIAESSNTVSDKEIGAILDDLSGELSSALDDTNNLEDLDDSDLDVSNIE